MEPLMTELEGFELQTRSRSNTWPLPKAENYDEVDPKVVNGKDNTDMDMMLVGVMDKPQLDRSLLCAQLPFLRSKKSSLRRNAWGNLSYADLITQAIVSVPEKRLTLSQIYEWMMQNVPYFKDKGDSNSSAGWKNSIRHNLSLHSRFMRVQNEGTGKSSWWMINPDAKPGKSSRRRATSMETSRFDRKRGQREVKRKIETLRNGPIPTYATPSPSSLVSEGSDTFSYSPLSSSRGFPPSPDLRSRASSNASSCGRLSPIPFSESEWPNPAAYPGDCVSEELAGNLAEGVTLHQEAFLQGGYTNVEGPSEPSSPLHQLPLDNFSSRVGLAASQYFGIHQCPIHWGKGWCSCALSQCAGERLSQTRVSPLCSQIEASSDSMSRSQAFRSSDRQRSLCNERVQSTPSTIMGQLMGALNNSTVFDDMNLNIETFHGGLYCNVDEVIKHELSMDGSLDFNFSREQAVADCSNRCHV